MRRPVISSFIVLFAAASAFPAFAGWDEGVAAFTAKNYPQAAAEFQQLVDQNPEGYRSHYMLGMSLQRMGRKEEALNHLREAYNLNPNDLSIKLELGKAYFTVRRYAEVSKLLKTVDPSKLPGTHQPAFYQMRGEAKLKLNDVDGGFSDFKALARLKPKDAKIQYKLGAVALKADQMDAAINALDRSVQLDPKDPDKKKTYANALIKKGRMTRDKTAKKSSYLKAAELASSVVSANGSFGNLMLQMSAELGAGLYENAVITGGKAMAKNSTDWLVPFYIGQAHTSSGGHAKAEDPLKKALGLAKNPADKKKVWKQLGFAYEKQKKYADSISAYQNAGDGAGVARVEKNLETLRYNEEVSAENDQIRRMEAEAKRLEEELKLLEEGGSGGV